MTQDSNRHLVAKLNPGVSKGHSIRKARTGRKNAKENQVTTYYFDVEKCKQCPLKKFCYNNTKTKTYSIRIKSKEHKRQLAFEETDYFKERSKSRYKIEAKNNELKKRHGYKKACSTGLFDINIQGATTLFVVNMKRIIKLKNERTEKYKENKQK